MRERKKLISVTAFNACIDACGKAGLVHNMEDLCRTMKEDVTVYYSENRLLCEKKKTKIKKTKKTFIFQ